MSNKVKKLFGILLTIALLTTVLIPYSFAVEESTGTDSAEVAQNVQSSAYVLVYPGMLPDNPLYFLKSLRDTFIGFMISDPLKKAEFDLLQSDKMIASSIFLIDQGNKQELAVVTAEKGHNFFADSLTKVKDAQKEGINTDLFVLTLASAAEKHVEVLRKLFEETRNQKFNELSGKSSEFARQAQSLQQ